MVRCGRRSAGRSDRAADRGGRRRGSRRPPGGPRRLQRHHRCSLLPEPGEDPDRDRRARLAHGRTHRRRVGRGRRARDRRTRLRAAVRGLPRRLNPGQRATAGGVARLGRRFFTRVPPLNDRLREAGWTPERATWGCPMVDATESWDEPLHPERRTAGPAVRVVLAEAAHAPGPLHYLLEGEGFQVLGSASDEDELTRLLSQSAQPEVIVVDAAVPVTTALVAREYAPGSELIVIWPEDVVPPPSADQVLPELVFQDLGPAVQRAAERNRARHPVIDEPAEPELEVVLDADRVELSAVAARRTAARVLVGTVALIASIIVTMGVSFALEGWRASHIAAPARAPLVTSSSTTGLDRSSTTGSTTQVTAHP